MAMSMSDDGRPPSMPSCEETSIGSGFGSGLGLGNASSSRLVCTSKVRLKCRVIVDQDGSDLAAKAHVKRHGRSRRGCSPARQVPDIACFSLTRLDLDDDVARVLAENLRHAGAVRAPPGSRLGIAVGVGGSVTLISRAKKTGISRNSASIRMNPRPARVVMDESVSSAALDQGAAELARHLGKLLIRELDSTQGRHRNWHTARRRFSTGASSTLPQLRSPARAARTLRRTFAVPDVPTGGRSPRRSANFAG